MSCDKRNKTIFFSNKFKFFLLLFLFSIPLFLIDYFDLEVKSASGINEVLSVGGKLTDGDGTNFSGACENSCDFQVKIFDSATGGTELYTENHSGVDVTDSIFDIKMGSINDLASDTDLQNFNRDDLYLEIRLDADGADGTYEEVFPASGKRIQFSSVAYAYNAKYLAGIDASEYMRIGAGSVQTDSTTNSAIHINKSGASGNLIEMEVSGGDVFVVDYQGDVTISGALTADSTVFTPAASSTQTEGRVYYDSDDDNLYVYDGTQWVDLTIQGSTNFLGLSDTKSSYSTGSVMFWDGSQVDESSDLFWDDINARLAIGKNSADYALDVLGSAKIGDSDSGSFSYSKEITIDSTKVDADLTDYPLLYSVTDSNLATTANGGHIENTDATGGASGSVTVPSDMIFSSTSDCSSTNQLDHEVEKYDATTGELVAHIRIPDLSSSVDTSIYVCYGDSNVTVSQENVTGVWDDNYAGVWHMGEGDGTAYDSTSNGNDATDNISATGTTGKIGSGQEFDGSDDYLIVNDHSSLKNENLTISYWLNTNNLSNRQGILNKRSQTDTSYSGFEYRTGLNEILSNDNSIFDFRWYSSSSDDDIVATSSISIDEWYHVSYILDDSNGFIYLDGSEDASTTNSITLSTSKANPIFIGATRSGSRHFNGYLDEIRISKITREGNWISATYNNQNSPSTFYTTGTETTPNSGVFYVDDSTNRVGVGTITPATKFDVGGDFVVTDSGRVGIGTTSPGSILEISDGTNQLFSVSDGGDYGIITMTQTSSAPSTCTEGELYSNDDGNIYYCESTDTWTDLTGTSFAALSDTKSSYSTGSLLFWDGSQVDESSSLYWDDSNSSLGIGNMNPSDMLHLAPVAYNSNEDGGIRLTDTGNNWIYRIALKTDSSGNPRLGFDTDDGFGTAENLSILGNGNVGIGTTSPDYALQVDGIIAPEADDTYSLGTTSLRWSDLYLGGSTLHIGASSTDEGLISYDSTNDVLGIATDGTTGGDIAFNSDDLYIDTSESRLGIGTTSPSVSMEIGSNGSSDNDLIINSDTSGSYLKFASRGDWAGFYKFGNQSLDMGTVGTAPLTFKTSNTEAMRIVANGNVGIGTTNPEGTLHIHTATAGNVTPNGAADDLVVEQNGAGGISILTPDAHQGALIFGSPSDTYAAKITWNHNDDLMQVGTTNGLAELSLIGGNANEGIRIDNSGNVGIGTSSPSSILHIDQSDENGLTFSRDNHETMEIALVGSNRLSFMNNNDSVENLVIENTGHVGIGTTDPNEKLTVDGVLSFEHQTSAPTSTSGYSKLYAKEDAEPDSNTLALLHMDGTDGGSTFTDSSPNTRTFTAADGAYTETSVKELGTASLYVDGNGDLIWSTTDHSDYRFDSDFTIEFWFKDDGTANGVHALLYSNGSSNNYDPWIVYKDSTGDLKFWASSNGSSWDIASSLSMGSTSSTEFVHYAIVRSNGTIKTYRNGTYTGNSATSSATPILGSRLEIGGESASNSYSKGYFDEVRISDAARWTSNFTPSSSAYAGSVSKLYWLDDDGTEYELTSSGGIRNRWWESVTGGISYDGGNVGIGTNSPDSALEINGSDNDVLLLDDGASC